MHARRGDMGRPRCPMTATAAQNAKFPPQYRRYTFDRPDGREAALSEKMQKKLHVTQECGINNELDVALAHWREYETCRLACFVADWAVLAVIQDRRSWVNLWQGRIGYTVPLPGGLCPSSSWQQHICSVKEGGKPSPALTFSVRE